MNTYYVKLTVHVVEMRTKSRCYYTPMQMILYRLPQEEMFITTTLNVSGEYISSLMAPNIHVPE